MLGVTYRGKLSGMTKHTKNYPPGKFGWVDYLPYPPTCTSIKTYSDILHNGLKEEAVCATIRAAKQVPNTTSTEDVEQCATPAWNVVEIPYKSTVKHNPLRSEFGGTNSPHYSKSAQIRNNKIEKIYLNFTG